MTLYDPSIWRVTVDSITRITMPNGSITDYYGVRTHKRKFAPDGELHGNKMQLLDAGKSPESRDPLRAESTPGKGRAVSRLVFDEENEDSHQSPVVVPFKKLSPLSPVKNRDDPQALPGSSESSGSSGSQNPEVRRKLSPAEIKRKLLSSSRLNELRERMSRFNKGYAELQEKSEPKNATLQEFRSIEMLLPVSPTKQSRNALSSPFTSPVKDAARVAPISPFKSPSKVPAYLLHASLAESKPSLTLPHHYRWLGEVFRAVDTACSLLHNRKEIVTFSKIKPAAQEMLKKNVTERHLAQIKNLSPQMYTFSRDKVRNFGMTSRKEEYDLVITPNLINGATGSPVDTMTSAVVLDRRRSFYNLLIGKVKDLHDDFLNTLDPPMKIPRGQLKCWHPEFDLERIPDIECDDLPVAPNSERFSTAQDVLSKAREMFTDNPRIERALRKLIEEKGTDKSDKAETINKTESVKQVSEVVASSEISIINPALKNIPDALLQRVRARQAEKALQSMTRTLMQSENILLYQRLPDLARTVRNVFVTEKKSVLPLETVISKLDNSTAFKLPHAELLNLLKSLSKEVPEWLTFHNLRKAEFIKMAKTADMNNVITKLEALANKHMI